jgi:hypothetical protein
MELALQSLKGMPKGLLQLLAPLAFQAAMAEWEASDPLTILERKIRLRNLEKELLRVDSPSETSRIGAA